MIAMFSGTGQVYFASLHEPLLFKKSAQKTWMSTETAIKLQVTLKDSV